MPPRKPKAAAAVAVEEPLARLPTFSAGVSTPMDAPAPTATEERRERDLEELLEAVGTDGRLRVWHVIEGKAVYAGEMTLDGFSLDTLLDTFGGGDKSLVFYQGKTRRDTIRVSLDPSIPPRNPRAAKGGAPGAAPGTNNVTDIASVLASMATMNMQSMQASQQMMTGMVTAVTTLLAAKPERDPMDTALKMAEVLNKGRDGGTNSATELFSIFEKGMNVAAKLNPGNEDDGTLGLAREGLGIVAKIIENNKAAPVAVVPAPVHRGLPPANAARSGSAAHGSHSIGGGVRTDAESGAESRGAAPTHDTDTGGGDMGSGVKEPSWVDAARPSLPLFSLAIGNVSADTAANMIADRLSEDEFGSLIDDIEHGTPGEFLTRFQAYFDIRIPDDNTYRWCLELVQSLKALVDDDEPGDDEPGADESGMEGDSAALTDRDHGAN